MRRRHLPLGPAFTTYQYFNSPGFWCKGATRVRTEISVVGGLGNQLFVIAYALYRERIDDREVSLRVVRSSRSNKTHGTLVLDSLSTDFHLETRHENFFEHWGIKALRFLIQGNCLSSHDGQRIPNFMHEGEFLSAPGSRPHPNRRCMETGYFQNPTFLMEIQKSGLLRELTPSKPSEWYQRKMNDSMWFTALAVHVRRGDFANTKGPGLLAAKFYMDAIKIGLEYSVKKRVVVFSDSIDEVRELFLAELPYHEFEFVCPPLDSLALESMALMSRFHTLVISNSTFGWWAAATGLTDKVVIAPEFWKSDDEHKSPLLLEGWHVVPSSWSKN